MPSHVLSRASSIHMAHRHAITRNGDPKGSPSPLGGGVVIDCSVRRKARESAAAVRVDRDEEGSERNPTLSTGKKSSTHSSGSACLHQIASRVLALAATHSVAGYVAVLKNRTSNTAPYGDPSDPIPAPFPMTSYTAMTSRTKIRMCVWNRAPQKRTIMSSAPDTFDCLDHAAMT